MMQTAVSHLTNLTSFEHQPISRECCGDDEFPDLPVAPGLLELDLRVNHISSDLAARMPNLTWLMLGYLIPEHQVDDIEVTEIKCTRILEGLKHLRHLEMHSNACYFSGATSLEVLVWGLGGG